MYSRIKTILLSAGLGTRLHPLTGVLPKCLMPVNGRPLMEYWLNTLDRAGLHRVLVNTHYRHHSVENWLKQSGNRPSIEIAREEKLLGTGGSLVRNRKFIGNDPVLVIHGDNLCNADFSRFIQSHAVRPPGCLITMMTFDTETPWTCGIIEKNEKGIVTGFHEKTPDPPGRTANGAVYVMEPEVIDFMAGLNKNHIDLSTEVIPRFLGRIYAVHNHGVHRDIGGLTDYLKAQIEAVEIPDLGPETDAWQDFCRPEKDLPARFLTALENALNVKAVSVEGIDDVLSRGDAGNMLLVNMAESGEADLNESVLGEKVADRDHLLFFSKAPRHFSSKKWWEIWGLKTLALYAPRCDSKNGEVNP